MLPWKYLIKQRHNGNHTIKDTSQKKPDLTYIVCQYYKRQGVGGNLGLCVLNCIRENQNHKTT